MEGIKLVLTEITKVWKSRQILKCSIFWKWLHVFDSVDKIKDFTTQYSATIGNLLIETLMKEIKPSVLEKLETIFSRQVENFLLGPLSRHWTLYFLQLIEFQHLRNSTLNGFSGILSMWRSDTDMPKQIFFRKKFVRFGPGRTRITKKATAKNWKTQIFTFIFIKLFNRF